MPCSTCTTRSPSFRSRKSAACAPKVRGRRGALRGCARGPKMSSSEERANRSCSSTNPAEISPVIRCACTAGSKSEDGSGGSSGTMRAISRRSSSSRRARSVLPVVPGDLRAQLRGRLQREVDLRDARRRVGGESEAAQLEHRGVVQGGTHVALVQVVLLGRQRQLARSEEHTSEL